MGAREACVGSIARLSRLLRMVVCGIRAASANNNNKLAFLYYLSNNRVDRPIAAGDRFAEGVQRVEGKLPTYFVSAREVSIYFRCSTTRLDEKSFRLWLHFVATRVIWI